MQFQISEQPQLEGWRSSGIRSMPRLDQDAQLASLGFLILRYTATPQVSLFHLEDGKLKRRRWSLVPESQLKHLVTAYSESPLEELVRSGETELSAWNPLYMDCPDIEGLESKLHLVQLQGIYPDILFCSFLHPEPGCCIFSSIPRYQSEYLNQIQNHWIHSTHLLITVPDAHTLTQSILTEKENDQILGQWNATDEPLEKGQFEFEEIEKRTKEAPQRIAVSSPDGQLSYGELHKQSNQLAHFLQQLGVGPEVVVGLYLSRSIEFVVSLIALKKSGGAFLPLDPDHPTERKEFLIKDSRVPFIITARRWVNTLPTGSYQRIILEDIEKEFKRQPTHTPEHGLKDGNMSYLFYTSGSTGLPKGVMMSLRSKRLEKNSGSTADDHKPKKVMLKSSTGFTVILLETFTPLTSGGEIVVIPKGKETDGPYLVEKIRQEKIETLNLVPSLLSLLLLQDGIEKCTSLRKVFTVGERLPVSVQREFFQKLPHTRLFVFFGCTEAPGATFREISPNEDYGDCIVLGKPMANKKVYILDPFGVPTPIGVTGEIFLGGNISRGYIHNDQLTRERFHPNPFTEKAGERMYQTGDLGRFLKDGSLEYIGRSDFQVQIRGVRIELGEIEACLSRHPQINEAVVIARKSRTDHTLLVAYYTCKAGNNPGDDILRTYVQNSLPDYMVPARFIQLDSFPLNTSGKIDRLNFPDPESVEIFKNGQQIFEGYSSVQTALRTLFFKTLGVTQFLNTESFFNIGGDSLLAVLAINRINKRFRVKLSLPDFHENPTILALEKLLQNKGYTSEFDLLVKIRTGVGKHNLFIVSTHVSVESFLSDDWDIYILRGLWHNERFNFSLPLSSLVDRYVTEILMVQKEAPFYLAGYSMGGTIAHQIACKLKQLGHAVAGLHLIDPVPPLATNRPFPRSNISAFWLHLTRNGLKNGPGIILSYALNMLGLKPLVRHRFTLANRYTRTLVYGSEYEVFDGSAQIYHRKEYGQENLKAWDELITGNLSYLELDTTDHLSIDRYPIQKAWCEKIRP
jgi:amino acid adenylation domain-containing protein